MGGRVAQTTILQAFDARSGDCFLWASFMLFDFLSQTPHGSSQQVGLLPQLLCLLY
jgi:hypothetical protein